MRNFSHRTMCATPEILWMTHWSGTHSRSRAFGRGTRSSGTCSTCANSLAGVTVQSGESSMSLLKADADEIPQEPPKGPSAEHQVWSRPKTGPVLMNSDVQQTGGGRQGAEPERVRNQVKSVGSPPLVVEVFAGKASLSRALLEAGFAVLSVDHEIKDPQTPIAALDLTTQSGQVVLWSMLEQPNLFAVHLGVLCGTSSRARERPVPKHPSRLGAPSPKPLRSGVHPLGVPGLSPTNQARVDSANTLYKLTLNVTLHCLAKGIGVSIENPANSWTWAVSVALLVRDYDDSAKPVQPVLFHSCCHGGQRKKATQWLSTPDLFASLAAECQANHPHEPFSVSRSADGWLFDTSLEAAYLKLLAQRVAACLCKWAVRQHWSLAPPLRVKDLSTAFLGRRSKRHRPLIPEYKHIQDRPVDYQLGTLDRALTPHLRRGSVREVTDDWTDSTFQGDSEMQGVSNSGAPSQQVCNVSEPCIVLKSFCCGPWGQSIRQML